MCLGFVAGGGTADGGTNLPLLFAATKRGGESRELCCLFLDFPISLPFLKRQDKKERLRVMSCEQLCSR